ncbi:pilus assembly PilX N-terminal domain-containing protein [Candidatus Sumerlaeota bacterium]|nr:pilus assembly PilX N-terminal domain-containing protein [Candidatus Sumerlaeota bacterium]
MKRRHLTANKRGSLLMVSFILCMVISAGVLMMIKTLLDHQKTNQRRRDLNRAYYAAEAGVAQVQRWGTYPEEYDNLDEEGLFYRDPDSGEFPNLTEALNEQGEYVISGELLASFASKYNFDVSNINEIALIPPDPDNDPVPCLFKVRSEGATPSGSTRRILAYLEPNPIEPLEIQLHAGLISLSDAAQQGNGHVHWGESWSKADFSMLSRPHCTELNHTSEDYDPFAKYRTEAQILFDSTWKSGLNKDIFEETTRRWPGSDPASGEYAASLEQFIPEGVLQWPDLLSQYSAFKNHAKGHGRYYTTDADGNIYKDGIEDEDHLVLFDVEFADIDRATSPYDFVFIDTIDGNFPAEDGSNLATIRCTGTGRGMKGIYWLGGNFYQGGSGNPEALVAEKPILNEDGSITFEDFSIPKVFLDGVLYMAGTAQFQANPVVYGSIISQKGYLSGGTPEIYFNHKLKDGLEIDKGNVGSMFYIQLQKNF